MRYLFYLITGVSQGVFYPPYFDDPNWQERVVQFLWEHNFLTRKEK